MKKTMLKCAKISILGGSIAILAACVDVEEQERAEKAALAAKSCSELSAIVVTKNEESKKQAFAASAYTIASAFSGKNENDMSGVNAMIAKTAQVDLQKKAHEVELLMAKKGCK